MSTTLAFDTCFGACSVALRFRASGGAWTVREDYREMATGHAEVLLPMVEQVMREAGVAFGGLTRLAVTAGPGSFTGVRIGLSAARGFKLALGLPVATLTSLMVMAARAEALLASGQFGVAREGAALVPCVDARGGNIYAEAFGADIAQPLTPPRLWAPEDLAGTLGGQRIIAVGSGGSLLVAAVRAAGGQAAAVLPGLQPHARHLVLLADAAPTPANLNPLYLRETDAKPMGGPTRP
jgi:tRNA threonylcarbamoyladenosine biosynthesis protein TsaB